MKKVSTSKRVAARRAETTITEPSGLQTHHDGFRAEEVRTDQLVKMFNGTELFSRFTADIIKRKTLFPR